MSAYDGYDDEPRRYRNVQTRPRERGEPDYVREETYIERGKGAGPRDLVGYRGRDDSIEDIPRDFPPPGGRDRGYNDYRRSSYRSDDRRSKSAGRSRYDDDSEDDRYTQYSRRSKRDKRRSRRDDRDYDSEYSDETRSTRKDRRKSGIEDVLGGLGLGGIVGGLMGKKDRSRSGSRSDRSRRSGRSRSRVSRRRGSSSSRSSSRGGKKNSEKKWAQAAQAAIVAGAVEAFRSRKEAGPWTGDKGKRVATAALGAGGIDGLLDRNPNEKSKRHLAEAVIGGLAANRLANGPVSKSQERDGSQSSGGRSRSRSMMGRARERSRSVVDRLRGRSQSRGRSEQDGGGGGAGALKGLAAGGALAAAGKAIYDRVSKSKSRKGSRSRSSSADSYVPSRNRRRGGRRSPPSDTQSTRRSVAGTDRSRGQGSRGINGGGSNANGAGPLVAAGAGGGAAGVAAGGAGGDGTKTGYETDDSSSTTDMEAKRKHMRGKELLTAGLATIATIHAAHGVYSSMEAHENRHKLVAEGEMTPEEARKKQTKAWVQDAAAVGIAALGIKGAFSEWKEMQEHRYILPNHPTHSLLSYAC